MKPQEFITERQKVIDKSVTRLDDVLPQVQRQIFEKVVQRIDELETFPDGRIKPTAANLKIINSIVRKDAKSFFLTDEYKSAVIEFVKSFKDLGKTTQQYFKKIESGRPTDNVT